ncbi:MAG: hypothetical protein QOH12_3568, partial [Solirubrobacteraceae bacterium]|nr:hypothetical protein [Solirubrobacteraceae bacterium]
RCWPVSAPTSAAASVSPASSPGTSTNDTSPTQQDPYLLPRVSNYLPWRNGSETTASSRRRRSRSDALVEGADPVSRAPHGKRVSVVGQDRPALEGTRRHRVFSLTSFASFLAPRASACTQTRRGPRRSGTSRRPHSSSSQSAPPVPASASPRTAVTVKTRVSWFTVSARRVTSRRPTRTALAPARPPAVNIFVRPPTEIRGSRRTMYTPRRPKCSRRVSRDRAATRARRD